MVITETIRMMCARVKWSAQLITQVPFEFVISHAPGIIDENITAPEAKMLTIIKLSFNFPLGRAEATPSAKNSPNAAPNKKLDASDKRIISRVVGEVEMTPGMKVAM